VSVPEYELANKIRYEHDGAAAIVSACREVYVAKGKKYHHFTVGEADAAEILRHVLGPSGKLRAPAIRFGDTLLVGFNPDAYNEALNL
jgi:hypothetical protein